MTDSQTDRIQAGSCGRQHGAERGSLRSLAPFSLFSFCFRLVLLKKQQQKKQWVRGRERTLRSRLLPHHRQEERTAQEWGAALEGGVSPQGGAAGGPLALLALPI